ncbi:hypothetical protein KDM41_15315, partial [bacterium]|nr:hypothetical protein [bacterium]
GNRVVMAFPPRCCGRAMPGLSFALGHGLVLQVGLPSAGNLAHTINAFVSPHTSGVPGQRNFFRENWKRLEFNELA